MMPRVSTDPGVIQRRRETLHAVIQAERVLMDTERVYHELRDLLADLRRDDTEGGGENK